MKNVLPLLFSFFISSLAYAQLQNTGMEQWRVSHTSMSGGVDALAPLGWDTYDAKMAIGLEAGHKVLKKNLVLSDSDAHSGALAAKLTSYMPPWGTAIPAMLTNGNIDGVSIMNNLAQFVFSGGTAITKRIDTVSTWVKYTPVSNDTAVIYAEVIAKGKSSNGKDSTVGIGEFRIDQAIAAYQEVKLKIIYSTTAIRPDRFRITFFSSPRASYNAKVGSELLVDDVSYTTDATDTGVYVKIIPQRTAGMVKCYPNPAGKVVHVEASGTDLYTVGLYGINGKLVLEHTFNGKAAINIAHLAPGPFTWTVTDEEKNTIDRGKLIVSQ